MKNTVSPPPPYPARRPTRVIPVKWGCIFRSLTEPDIKNWSPKQETTFCMNIKRHITKFPLWRLFLFTDICIPRLLSIKTEQQIMRGKKNAL